MAEFLSVSNPVTITVRDGVSVSSAGAKLFVRIGNRWNVNVCKTHQNCEMEWVQMMTAG
jgi:hypothetical protein